MNLKSPAVQGVLFIITFGTAMLVAGLLTEASIAGILVGLAIVIPGIFGLVSIVRHERWVDEQIRIHNESDNPIKFEAAWF